MNIVDSPGWLSYFADDQNAVKFAKPIEKLEQLIVPSITLTEVFKRLLQQCNESIALQAIAHMQQGEVVTLDSRLIPHTMGLNTNFLWSIVLFMRRLGFMMRCFGLRMSILKAWHRLNTFREKR